MAAFPWMDSLRALVQGLERSFGRGIVTPLEHGGDAVEVDPLAGHIPTGLALLDQAVGRPGLPAGTMVELYGADGVGKTSLALALMAAAQRDGCTTAYLDVERGLQIDYATALGVMPDRMLLSRPSCAETAWELVEALVRSGEVKLVVVDSLAAMVPRAELSRPLDQDTGADQARLMSRALRRLAGAVQESGAVVVFVNQVRRELGENGQSVEVSGGGTAMRFYAGLRLELRRDGALCEGEERVGDVVRVEVTKSRFAPPHRVVRLPLRWGQGFVAPSPPTPSSPMPASAPSSSGAEHEAAALATADLALVAPAMQAMAMPMTVYGAIDQQLVC